MNKKHLRKETLRKARMLRLQRDIKEIQDIYFRGKTNRFSGDPDYEECLLHEQKTGLIRALVIHTNLLLESIATTELKRALLKSHKRIRHRRKALYAGSGSARYIELVLDGDSSIGMKRKIDLLRGLGLINARVYEKLCAINTVRNRAAHSIDLHGVVRKRKKRHGKKNPMLNYNGKNLYVLKNFHEFMDDTQWVLERLLHPSIRKLLK